MRFAFKESLSFYSASLSDSTICNSLGCPPLSITTYLLDSGWKSIHFLHREPVRRPILQSRFLHQLLQRMRDSRGLHPQGRKTTLQWIRFELVDRLNDPQRKFVPQSSSLTTHQKRAEYKKMREMGLKRSKLLFHQDSAWPLIGLP